VIEDHLESEFRNFRVAVLAKCYEALRLLQYGLGDQDNVLLVRARMEEVVGHLITRSHQRINEIPEAGRWNQP
jgi:hypothetical protein